MPTLTPSRPSDRMYAAIADGRERDPIQGGEGSNRATVPMGRHFAHWARFHDPSTLVWIDDAEGHPRAITTTQARILYRALEMADGAVGVTMRVLAKELRVAPSTISRALTKFAAWGLVAYMCGRGRYAGLVIFRRVTGDTFGYIRDRAKARVRRWKEAANRRVSRLWANVASYVLDEREGVDVYYYEARSHTPTHTRIGRNIDESWTVQDLRDAGII